MLPKCAAEREVFRQELLQDGLLCQSGTLLHFSHLSFLEFLAAKDFLCDPKPKRIASAMGKIIAGTDS
jgi:hypothetical protein